MYAKKGREKRPRERERERERERYARNGEEERQKEFGRQRGAKQRREGTDHVGGGGVQRLRKTHKQAYYNNGRACCTNTISA